MYLKTDKIIAYVDGLRMTSYKVPGLSNQYMLDPTALTGWTDGVNVRRDATARLSTNGDFFEPAKLSSRLISLSGFAVASSTADLQIMRDAFMSTLSNGEYQWLEIETNAGKRFSQVGLEGKPSWVQSLDTAAAWKLDLYAPDPFTYGMEQTLTIAQTTLVTGGLKLPLKYPLNYNRTVDAAAFVMNRGNATMWPIFKVQGTYNNGFEIFDNRNSKVTYKGVVTSQAPVYIDMGRGTATQNGVDKTVLVSNRDWFSVEPNETIRPEVAAINGGTGWCDVIFRDTYI
jgi:hypothetical protein